MMQTDHITDFGLNQRDIQTITAIFTKYPDIKEVHIFGSRAIGSFKPASDIDLAIMNDIASDRTLAQIKSDFDDSSLPYFVDIVLFTTLSHPELKEHIKHVGLPFYQIVQ
jgi:predicted nucleotidyltransferase